MYSDYVVYEYDLSTARTDTEVELNPPARKLIVLRADDEAYIRINDISKRKVYLFQNLKIDMKMSRVYLTNPSGSGKLILLFLW